LGVQQACLFHPLSPLLGSSAHAQLAISQSISGTGALRIATAFLSRFYPNSKTIYLPSPTWGNHIPIAKDSGLEVKHYK
jgi:aspartate aminotransferase